MDRVASTNNQQTAPQARPAATPSNTGRQHSIGEKPATWRACWEFVVSDRPAKEVAAELGLTVNAVYLAKSRVLRRLRHELVGLLD